MAGWLGILLAALTTPVAQASPLNGRPDAVILKGKALPPQALSARREQYRLYSQADSIFKPVPFQIDEYDPAGEIILPHDSRSRLDVDKGVFDENDELVFMASDSGDRAVGKPSLPGCDSLFEISIHDSGKGCTGYAYLGKCSDPGPSSPLKYVAWDESLRTASTDSYRMGYQLGNVAYYDYLSLFQGPDLLDRLKMRLSVGIGSLRKVFSEDDFHKEGGTAYLADPVRVVYANRCEISLGIFGSIPAPQYIYFYRNWVLLSNKLDFRFNPTVLGLDLDVEVLHDFSLPQSSGYMICSNAVPACVPITGKMTPEINKIVNQEQVWGGVRGPEGAMITRFVKDPRLSVVSTAIYLDDAAAENKPEYMPGARPEIGFRIGNWGNVGKGVYSLDFYHCFMKSYSTDEVVRFDRMIFEPLEVVVTVR
jgi:hypothetical protein